MLNFDFNSYVDSFINKGDYRFYLDKKQSVLDKFNSSNMIGWTKDISSSEINKMIKVSESVKSHSTCLVVIGIGGSFLGSYAVKEMLTPYFNDNSFKVIYAGTTLSSKYMSELLDYLKDIDFSVNVISKSGTTMETNITYTLIKELLDKKYSKEEVVKHIIMTTDKVKGNLREEVNVCGYESFIIPDDIGGRYSIMTAAHLFPLAFNIDINKFVKGLSNGHKYLDDAYNYAVTRRMLFDHGKVVENFCVYEQSMYYFTEWMKQLFGETEGKDGKGLLPVSTVHTRDLHSLGQFVQEGNKILFETFIKVKDSTKLNYNNCDLHDINNIVFDSVVKAHYSGDVPCLKIEVDSICEESIGEAMYFFMMSAAFSGYLFNVEPFNQPGVEVYKKEVRDNLGK